MFSRRRFITIGGASVAALGLADQILAAQAPDAEPKLKNLVEGVKPLTAEDYASRIEKARRIMAEKKLDGFFCEGGTSMKYFTNVSWGRSERTFGFVLTATKSPVWVCSRFELERAREIIPIDQEIRTWEEDESPYRLIGGIMRDAGVARGVLGIEPTTRFWITSALGREVPGLVLVDGAVVSESCRAIKTEKEIAFMEIANRITKLAYREGFKTLKENMTTAELGTAVREAHAKMGVTGGGWGSFGPTTAFPHGTKQVRNLQRGDVILIDGGCSVLGLSSDVTRTIVFGPPSDRQRKVWDAVKKGQNAALQACKPGNLCQDVDRAARRAIEEAGFGDGYRYFTHRLGHGIGMDGHEYPYLVRGNTLKIQPGMTFTNEPGLYIYGEFGVRIEDVMVVTPDGARFLGGMESVAIDHPFAEV